MLLPEITNQAGSQLSNVFLIPWGHIKVIMSRCLNNSEKALSFVNKTQENRWSLAMLVNYIDTDLYERQGKAATNFSMTLPVPQSDLAKAITQLRKSIRNEKRITIVAADYD